MPTPASLIPSASSFVGVARETVRGTAVAPVGFIPWKSITSPNDMPHYTPDEGVRGSAVKTYNQVATQTWAEPSMSGDVFPDTLGWWLLSLFGQVAQSGSPDGVGSGTLNASSAVGATSISFTGAGLSIGEIIQIGTGTLGETRKITTLSGTGPYTVGFATPLLYAHNSGVAVAGMNAAPIVHDFTVLNSSPFQPPSLTWTDYNGTDTFQVPGLLVEELGLKFSATGLLTYDVKCRGFKSSTTSKPTQSFSAEVVKPAWQGATTLGGVPTGLMEDGEINFKRSVDAVTAVNGTQDPAAIWGGGDFTCTGKLNLLYQDATEYTKFLSNTATAIDINFSAGASAALRAVQVHMSNCLYTAAPHTRSKSYTELAVSFEAVANTTDIGQSGGYGPAKVTCKSSQVAY